MKIKINPLWKELEIENEMNLITQLYDAYESRADFAEIVILNSPEAEKYFAGNCGVCGVKSLRLIKSLERKGILQPHTFNPHFEPKEKKNPQVYIEIVNWSKLCRYTGMLHDKEATNPYGIAEQKRLLKQYIGAVRMEKQTDEFWITEKIVGPFIAIVKTDNGLTFDRSLDHNIHFMTTLYRLAEEKEIIIKKIKYELNNKSYPCKEFGRPPIQNPQNPSFFFWPAEHCHVLIKINPSFIFGDETSVKKGNKIKKIDFITTTREKAGNLAPRNWGLLKKEEKGYLMKDYQVIFNFPNTWANEYKYFKCLWENYGQKVDHKTIFEYESNKNYERSCKKETKSKVNKYIDIAINKLRKKLSPFKIKIITSKGFILTVEQ
jgi:hypothetical protein